MAKRGPKKGWKYSVTQLQTVAKKIGAPYNASTYKTLTKRIRIGDTSTPYKQFNKIDPVREKLVGKVATNLGYNSKSLSRNQRRYVNQVIKQNKPVKLSEVTNLPGVGRKFFIGKTSVGLKARSIGTKKTGLILANGGHVWKRDNIGRLYLGFNGRNRRAQNATMKNVFGF